jgi:transposase
MWEFRRDPRELAAKGKQRLEELFERLPRLRQLYEIRVQFKEIFDRPVGRRKAGRELVALFLEAMAAFPELESFVVTYEQWQEEILNYFDARQTSAAVEGVNNKARVIIKRAYGLKSGDSLWTRLILDLNRAKEVVGCTLQHIRELVAGFRAIFSVACT